MKTVFSAVAFCLLAGAAQAQRPDTVVVRLPNQAVLTLQVRDAQQLHQLPQYHLDSLVARLGTYIAQADAAAKNASTDKVTLKFYPNQDRPGQDLPAEIKITTYKRGGQVAARRTDVTTTKLLGLEIKKELDENGRSHLSVNSDTQAQRDSLRQARDERQNGATFVTFDLGLNALTNRSPYTLPGGQPGDLNLRSWGSRYVSIGLAYRQRLGGKHSPLSLLIGPEFAFNNYMLQGNYKWLNQNDFTYVAPETNGRQYQKSKLATSAVNLPLMFNLRLHDQHHRRTLSVGVGGFVGYRLGSWTKLKYFENDKYYKDKDHNSYNLTNWQYGLQGNIGMGHLTLFAKYNLNKLFRDERGPQAQTLAFGVQLLGY